MRRRTSDCRAQYAESKPDVCILYVGVQRRFCLNSIIRIGIHCTLNRVGCTVYFSWQQAIAYLFGRVVVLFFYQTEDFILSICTFLFF